MGSVSPLRSFVIYLLPIVFMVRVQEIIEPLRYLKLLHVSVVLSLIAIASVRTTSAKILWARVSFVRWNVFFVICVVASIATSVWISGSIDSVIVFFSNLMMFYFLMFLVVDRKSMRVMVNSVFASLIIVGFAMVNSDASGRVSVGGAYDPNDIALIVVTFIPILVSEVRLCRGFRRILFASSVIVCVYALVLTQSRGAFVSVVILACYHIASNRKSVVRDLFVIVLIFTLIFIFSGEEFKDRMMTLTDVGSDYNMTADTGRIEIWKSGVEVILSRFFVLGVGIGQYSTALGTIGSGPWKTAHNSYLQIAVELGVQGFYCYVSMLFTAFLIVRKNIKRVSHIVMEKERWIGFQYSLIAYSVCSFFLSQGYGASLYFLLAIIGSRHVLLSRGEIGGVFTKSM